MVEFSGIWVEASWGLSFIFPGLILSLFSIVIWLFLVPKPTDVGLVIDNVEAVSPNEQKIGQINQSFETDDDPELKTQETKYEKIKDKEKVISFCNALAIPGVVEFALGLFFTKLVAYTFHYWLPTFIKEKGEIMNRYCLMLTFIA